MKILDYTKTLVLVGVSLGCIAPLSVVAQTQPENVTPAPSYNETYRPQFHFTPAKNWMNDPNGLVYNDGEYHLFYQHNPEGITWGHMSWGHAVSRDLLHWEHLPIALEELPGHMAFSGSVVVDKANTAGFQVTDEVPMVAVYSGYRQTDGWQAQFLAYSLDRGRNWKRYSEKPILDLNSTDFRDPRVFPYGKEWRMVIALPTERKVQIYSSKNLKEWTYLSDFGPAGAIGGAWECPDLFELPIQGEAGKSRWVLQVDLDRQARAGGSGGQYFVGDFDGTSFTVDQRVPSQIAPKGEQVVLQWKAVSPDLLLEGDSIESSREALGEAKSNAFRINDNWLNFKIRGGRHPEKLELRLIVDQQVVARTTGFNGENKQWHTWNTSAWRGSEAHLEFVDQTQELWGRLQVSDFELSPAPAPLSVDQGHWVDYGPDFYAALSFGQTPGRRVYLAWTNNWLYGQEIPTSPWRSAMSIPRELSLIRKNGGLELAQKPVRELDALRGETSKLERIELRENELLRLNAHDGSGEIQLSWQVGKAKKLSLQILGLDYHIDPASKTLTLVRGHNQNFEHEDYRTEQRIPISLDGGVFTAHILYDQSCVEVFTEDNTVSLTSLTFPHSVREHEFECSGGTSGPLQVIHNGIESVW